MKTVNLPIVPQENNTEKLKNTLKTATSISQEKVLLEVSQKNLNGLLLPSGTISVSKNNHKKVATSNQLKTVDIKTVKKEDVDLTLPKKNNCNKVDSCTSNREHTKAKVISKSSDKTMAKKNTTNAQQTTVPNKVLSENKKNKSTNQVKTQTEVKSNTIKKKIISDNSEPISANKKIASPKSDVQHKSSTEHKERKRRKKKIKYISELEPNGFTQDYLSEFQDIKGGLIQTKHNHYVGVIEIFPVNFHEKPTEFKREVLANFKRFFKISPINGHLKCVIERTDIKTIVNRIMEACPSSRGKKLVDIRNDYIQNIKSISTEQTVHYRYFYFWEYEGNNQGIKSTDFNKIYRQMMLMKHSMKEILIAYGNLVAEPEDATFYTADILYHLFNRATYMEESLSSRILRINYDCAQCGKKPTLRDYIAPKGIVFNNKEFAMIGGMYYTWLTLEDTAYPMSLPPDWISNLMVNNSMDVDFFYKKLPHDTTCHRLKKGNVWKKLEYKDTSNGDKKETIAAKYNNNFHIVKKMEAGEDLFDCCTVITLYANDIQTLANLRDTLCTTYDSAEWYTERCFMDCEEYFQMCLPLVNFENSIFKRNKRNFLTSSLKNLYCFTAYLLYDESAETVVLGPNLANGTISSINKFNTSHHVNPHEVIIGTSGAGKSFLEMALGRRDNIMNVKCYYILPVKAHEYIDACIDIDGEYIRCTPDSNSHYNFMELFPETAPLYSSLDGENIVKKSILSRKVTFLCTWFRMLSVKENLEKYKLSSMDINRLNALLVKLYSDFGITKDNDSIWEDKQKSIKKYMPLPSDWYERMTEDSKLCRFADLLLPFVTGIFRNMNNYTNIDITKDMIVFDVDVDDIGDDFLAPIMYIYFDLVSNLIKADQNHYASLYLDEQWKMMVDDLIAKCIEEDIRLLRAYGGSVVSASQNIGEFVGNKYGQAIMGNSDTKILLRMTDTEIELVSKYISLDANDKNFLRKAKQGDMLVISNGCKTRCHLSASIKECIAYNTDPKKKKEYIEILEAQEKQMGNNSVKQYRKKIR